jgi:hypothetical protein
VSSAAFVDSLRPFLFDRTELLVHELEWFVRSPFGMDQYDSLVKYTLPIALYPEQGKV